MIGRLELNDEVAAKIERSYPPFKCTGAQLLVLLAIAPIVRRLRVDI